MSKQARTRTQEMRKAQQEAAERAAKRRRLLTVIGGLVIIGLVAAIIFVVIRAAGGDDSTSASDDVVTPANTSDGAIPVGDESAPVTVTIYYDYMCPACGAFEEANGEELDQLLEAGEVQLELRPISFLDRMSSGTEYSTRSANAVATVADDVPEDVWAFHQALYDEQPEEGSEGLSDEEIATIAVDAGVPQDVVDQFADDTYESWVAAITEQAFDSGIEGTPTILIDGEEFQGDPYTTGPLTDAIQSAGE
jgi:protein-disulfide isomerase